MEQIRQVDIYDFDKTMLPYDSGTKFCLFCLVRYPWIVISVPLLAFAGLLYLLHIWSLDKTKGYIYRFIALIPLKKAVEKFWDKHEKDIYDFARPQNRARATVVISASPDFLLKEIAKRLAVDKLICTEYDPKTGKIFGLNCKREEKVVRFRKFCPQWETVAVYSDSLKHDRWIFSLGRECYHIVKGERIPFDYKEIENQYK